MSKLCLFFCVVLLVHAGLACDGNEDEELATTREQQESAEYLANAYGFAPNPWSPYYQSRVPGYANMYEGRAPINKKQASINPFMNYFSKNYAATENDSVEGRFGLSQLGSTLLNVGLFNNRFTASGTTLNRPFAGLGNRLPIIYNPNYANPISNFDSCTAPSGEAGICSPGSVCSLFGGRPSGSCLLGGVCCINAVTTCGGSVTLNNTFWQSPTTAVSSISTCALTVKLNTQFVEQKKPICQIRLDFVSFSIAQPSVTSACTDTFQIGGAINNVPIICGDNNGQHMYLQVPPSDTNPTDLQLMFNFGSTVTTRSWNIKIAMLPCGANYLAPADCLQYFTSSTGKAISFNWKDTAATAPRQLLNQDVNICFRTELVNNQRAKKLCLTPCATASANANAFWLSGAAGVPVGSNAITFPSSGVGAGAFAPSCPSAGNFLLIPNGKDNAVPPNAGDRFCGGFLSAAPVVGFASSTICTTVKPFRITYETAAFNLATEVNDQGFCLGFAES